MAYRESRSTLLLPERNRVKLVNVKARQLHMGDPVVNEVYDKKGRLEHHAKEVKVFEVFGKTFKCHLHHLEYKANDFGYVVVTQETPIDHKLYGIGKSKKRAWNNIKYVIEGYLFGKYGNPTYE